jgi:signal transduction histidine kinase
VAIKQTFKANLLKTFPKTVSSALAQPEETRLGKQFADAARARGGNSGFRILSVGVDGFLAVLAIASAYANEKAEPDPAQSQYWGPIRQLMFADRVINLLLRTPKARLIIDGIVYSEVLKGLAQAVQGTAKDKRVNLSTKVDGSVGRVMVDWDKLEKIILNLLFNALKFTGAGGQVDLTSSRQGTQLALIVRDTGMGISEQNLPYIFDRFWQADSASNRKYQGTGIGLALVKELAEAQGGTVEAESRLGKGTTMTIRVPYEEAKDFEIPAPTKEKAAAEMASATDSKPAT